MGTRLSLATVVFAFLIPATPASALGAPLETAASPVKDVIAQVTTTVPPIVPIRPPAPVNLPTTPVETPTASEKPSMPPAEPPVSPASVDVPIVKTSSSSQPAPPMDLPAGPSPAPAAEAVTSGTAGVVGETAQAAGGDREAEAVRQRTSSFRSAEGATAASSSVVPRAPLAAPLRQLLVYVWPAVALGRPALATFLDRVRLGVASLVVASRTDSASAAEMVSRSERAPVGGIGVADRLSPHFYALSDRFVPGPPLPLAALYFILAAGIAAIWCVSRREVGLRTLSRRRRI